MTREGKTAEAVSRTVWVLAQIRGYQHKQDLAARIGWSRQRLNRLLSGQYEWTLSALEEVSDALGLDGPGDLFKPLAELVGAAEGSDGGVIGMVTEQYPGATSAPNGRLAQVIRLRPSYHSVTSYPATPAVAVTRLDASRRGGRAHTA